jgi:cation diffusion facilitator family transporter
VVVTADATRRGVRRVLLATLGLNLSVSVSKIVVGSVSGSVSMVADGYHSLTDGANNVVGLVVTAFAFAPPDEGHPYGHRKFETAASLAIGLLLLSVAYHILTEALARASTTRVPDIGLWNWIVMVVTLATNFFVSWWEAREGRRLASPYLLADATHTRSDIYVSLGVMASFAGARAGFSAVDVVVALGIAGFIAVLAVRILVGSFNTLTDRAMIPAESLAGVVRDVPGVISWSDIRTRGGPGLVYVDLIARVDGELTLREAHDVADAIEEAVRRSHPEVVDVVVHLEPAVRP